MESASVTSGGRHGEATVRLPASLAAWGTPSFAGALKREMEALGPARFPLQPGLSSSSYALDGTFSVMFLAAAEAPGTLRAKVGVFFSGITAGRNCADDPTPVEPHDEYCELVLEIDRTSADTRVSVAGDGEQYGCSEPRPGA